MLYSMHTFNVERWKLDVECSSLRPALPFTLLLKLRILLAMNSAIIVAAGQGTRMGPNRDKLFIEVHGCPVVGHTWKRFDGSGAFQEIILVVRPGREAEFEALAGQLGLSIPYRLVPGGAERQDSVWNGLTAVASGTELVAIQDGARPCTSHALIKTALEAAKETGAAVVAERLTDTIKESADGQHISRHLDRSKLWAVQTPQCFRVGIIRQALQEVRAKGLRITDDTAACEWIGQPVRLVPGDGPNPKLTLPSDVTLMEQFLQPLTT